MGSDSFVLYDSVEPNDDTRDDGDGGAESESDSSGDGERRGSEVEPTWLISLASSGCVRLMLLVVLREEGGMKVCERVERLLKCAAVPARCPRP